MAKEKMKYESMKELVKSVEELKEEIHSALGDATRIASDSKLAMSVDKEWKLTKAQTAGLGAGLGAAASAAGVAAYFGPALPLIASTTLATGLVAWPLVAAGAGVTAIGAVGGKIIHSSIELKDCLLEYCDVQPGIVDELVNQIQEFDGPLQKEFYAYLEGQELSEEYKSLMDKQELLPVGAFIMRDWMEKEPEAERVMREYF